MFSPTSLSPQSLLAPTGARALHVLLLAASITLAGCEDSDSDGAADGTSGAAEAGDAANDDGQSGNADGSAMDDGAADEAGAEEGAEVSNLVDVLAADGRFSTLITAATEADLVGALTGEGPMTLFAPTDEAFAALPDGALEGLLADKEALANVLLHHVVAGDVRSTDLPDVPYAKSLAGQTLLVDLSDGANVGGADVIDPDLSASNGVIHAVDSVILPPTDTVVGVAVANEQFSTLVAAVQAAELVETLSGEGPFTVFAPTNDAFDALPEGALEDLLNDKDALTAVLLHHVAAGEVYSADLPGMTEVNMLSDATPPTLDLSDGVKVGSATVIAADVLGTNGVIHVIDSVLLPQ